ncbi:porin family protein [Fusobacterium necrophorum]|uniref:Porin family protein n=1 Tax=Fusobacterium necrophorum TaxID=859 RepID=A0A4Q2L146_9FUSO|nr:outer membrane beta-barrel protein [Fusobacterium necrophorum]RXZ71087.1 porin family protein [Fusobacterium necrophorum]
MKRLVLALMAITSITAAAENHIYGKVGGDFYTRFSRIDRGSGSLFEKNHGRGLGIFLEATTDVTPNVELGAGIGYIRRANGKNIERTLNEQYIDKWKTVRYDSIPLYATAKYNFIMEGEIKPYVKADLGYSFNHARNKVYEDTKPKVKNGLYAGVGIGMEYGNFVTELSYNVTGAKVSVKGTDYTLVENQKYNNAAVRFSVGYKFNF